MENSITTNADFFPTVLKDVHNGEFLMIKKLWMIFILLAVLCGMALTAFGQEAASSLSHEGYKLEQVVVFSRHNIRSPLSEKGSVLDTITPHEWFHWSSNPGELSLRGGVLETEMGEYFRKWLESEGLFPENYHPVSPEVRIYANSMQRTIATAQFFTGGLLPTANMPVEYHAKFGTMDPVFNPVITHLTNDLTYVPYVLTHISDAYLEYAKAQIRTLFTKSVKDLTDNYALLSEVIDVENSEAWKDGSFTGFRTDDFDLVFEDGKEPTVVGSLKTACSVSDALVLQYYEEPDAVKAAFGKELTMDQWKQIAEIKDVYEDARFAAPLVSNVVAYPLLKEIYTEMNTEGRVFSFLCGHDVNIVGLMSALDVAKYDLPETIESRTPIGSKMVFSKWLSAEGEEYWSVDLVYQSSEQLRNMPLLDLENPPVIFHLTLNGLDQNADGLYTAADMQGRIEESFATYEQILENFVDVIFTEDKIHEILDAYVYGE